MGGSEEGVESLKENPRPGGVKKLSGESELYRISVAKKYRVVYQIRDDKLIVLVVKLGHRKDIGIFVEE